MAKVYKTSDGKTYKTDPTKLKSAQQTKNKVYQSDTKLRKQTFINYAKNGKGVKEACQDMGLTLAQYKYLRQSDGEFRAEMDKLLLMVGSSSLAADNRVIISHFAECCDQNFATTLFHHHIP